MARDSCNRTRSGPALAAVLAIGLLVGYQLSIGPMSMIYGMTGQPKNLLTAIDVIYAPIGWRPDSLSRRLSEWAEFCFDLGERAFP